MAHEIRFSVSGNDHQTSAESGPNGTRVVAGGKTTDIQVAALGGGLYRLTGAGRSQLAWYAQQGNKRYLHLEGRSWELERRAEAAKAATAQGGDGAVRAPMHGVVRKILVAPGEAVREHQRLVILEAMKMENDLKAPCAGRVRQVHVREGEKVEGGALLIEIEPAS